MRRNAKIEYEFTLASRCIATSVDTKATQRIVQRRFADFSWCWNKINASSRDGTLFVATSVDTKAMQRNALCSVNSQTFRGTGTSAARVRWTARYARASAGLELRATQARVRDSSQQLRAVRACALPILEEGPLGTISVLVVKFVSFSFQTAVALVRCQLYDLDQYRIDRRCQALSSNM